MTSPLAGKRVLLPRAEGQSDEAVSLLRARGAEPVLVPAIAIGAPDDEAAAERAVASLSTYGWIAFTSANGVDRTFELLARAGESATAFGDARVAVVGPATAAALARHGLSADVVATDLRGEGLAAAMLARMTSARVLVLRAQTARDALPDALRAAGSTVDVVAVYATRAPPDLAENLEPLLGPSSSAAVDAVIFTSSSTVKHVCGALGPSAAERLGAVKVTTIGPVTAETARSLGVRVDAQASPYTVPAAIDALEACFVSAGKAAPTA